MRRFKAAGMAVVGLLVAAVAAAVWSSAAEGGDKVKATLVDGTGRSVGKADIKFRHGRSEVKVAVQLPASAAGFHGFHIHAKGECVGDFTSAGGHLGESPSDAAHRHRNHEGDLPVLLVHRDGRAEARFETDRLRLAGLRDADGSAFIVHALPDNYANIPSRYSVANPVPVYPGTTTDQTTLSTGDAGGRLACGVIR